MMDASFNAVLCNGARLPKYHKGVVTAKPLILEYRASASRQNINLSLPNFVRGLSHLPDRVLDLLELATYIFAADRLVSRGRKEDLEYHGWQRSFYFVVKVRDPDFWNRDTTKGRLRDALVFMSGDREYEFAFEGGHSTPPTSLFDSREFLIESSKPASVIMFSGGLDSLAGALDRLENSQEHVCLVSHGSQPSTKRTQSGLVSALQRDYVGRVRHYKFNCTLRQTRADEESQRTRAFLYTSIPYALSSALAQKEFFVYENGMTALNFPKRQDMMNARASRTVHPKTIALLQDFFSEVAESQITITTPFLWKTKADVLKLIAQCGRQDLISSSVSCSKTFQNLESATHCGGCSQCIDRRFAAYSCGMDDVDESGIYASDFIGQAIEDGETRTLVTDYVRQASDFAKWNIDHFYKKTANELVQIADYVGCTDEESAVEHLYDLAHRHGTDVHLAIKRMRDLYDDPYRRFQLGSFIQMISEREYLKEPVQRLVESLTLALGTQIRTAFRKHLPVDEPDFNDKVSALLQSHREEFEREHPAIRFALANAVPDHSSRTQDLLIESKFIRRSTTPSKASEGISADMTKYPDSSHILFLVYDPDRAISNPDRYKKDLEVRGKGRCTVCVIR